MSLICTKIYYIPIFSEIWSVCHVDCIWYYILKSHLRCLHKNKWLNAEFHLRGGWVTHCKTRVRSLMACTATSYSLSRVIDTMRSCQWEWVHVSDTVSVQALHTIGCHIMHCYNEVRVMMLLFTYLHTNREQVKSLWKACNSSTV